MDDFYGFIKNSGFVLLCLFSNNLQSQAVHDDELAGCKKKFAMSQNNAANFHRAKEACYKKRSDLKKKLADCCNNDTNGEGNNGIADYEAMLADYETKLDGLKAVNQKIQENLVACQATISPGTVDTQPVAGNTSNFAKMRAELAGLQKTNVGLQEENTRIQLKNKQLYEDLKATRKVVAGLNSRVNKLIMLQTNLFSRLEEQTKQLSKKQPAESCNLNFPVMDINQGEYQIPNKFIRLIPEKSIVIEKAYAIMERKVTLSEFCEYLSDSGQASLFDKLGCKTGSQKSSAASGLTWIESTNYARWLADKTGCAVNLPAYEQWAAAVSMYGGNPDYQLTGESREWTTTSCTQDDKRDTGYYLAGTDKNTKLDKENGPLCPLIHRSYNNEYSFRLVINR